MLSPGGIPKVTTSPQTLSFPHAAAAHPRLTDGGTDRHLQRQREGARVPGLSGGTSQRQGTKKGGSGSQLATCLWNMRRGTGVQERGQGPPPAAQHRQNLSSGFTLQDSIHSPDRGTKPPAIPTRGGQRLLASPLAVRAFGGPCLPPSVPPGLQPRSAGAQGRGGRRGLMVLRGMGAAPTIRSPRSSPAHAALLPRERPQGPLRAAGVGWPLGTARLGTPLPSSR